MWAIFRILSRRQVALVQGRPRDAGPVPGGAAERQRGQERHRLRRGRHGPVDGHRRPDPQGPAAGRARRRLPPHLRDVPIRRPFQGIISEHGKLP